ncbi:MAG: DUF2267 domain-containing protein [Myxococcales bacterium]|jgi:uncharacterized protein (DUF2267 family)
MAYENLPGEQPGTDFRALRHESRAASTYKAFLKNLSAMGDFDEAFAEKAAVSVLAALEQRIYGEEVRDLEAQLPYKLRELLAEVPHHEGKPQAKFGRQQFFEMVANDLNKSLDEIEPIIRAVFMAVRSQITEGEAEDVADQLPSDLAELWRLPA